MYRANCIGPNVGSLTRHIKLSPLSGNVAPPSGSPLAPPLSIISEAIYHFTILVDDSKKVRFVNISTSQLDQGRVVPKLDENAEFFRSVIAQKARDVVICLNTDSRAPAGRFRPRVRLTTRYANSDLVAWAWERNWQGQLPYQPTVGLVGLWQTVHFALPIFLNCNCLVLTKAVFVVSHRNHITCVTFFSDMKLLLAFYSIVNF